METNMQESENHPASGEHLFNEEDVAHYEYASTGQRFGNLIIDMLVINYGLGIVTGFAMGLLLMEVAPDILIEVASDTLTGTKLLFSFILGVINHLIYYTICEKAFRGYTLGKLITGTRAIRLDGGELTLKDAFQRSLSRIVPFETLSAIWGAPWHDTWTNTTVIRTR